MLSRHLNFKSYFFLLILSSSLLCIQKNHAWESSDEVEEDSFSSFAFTPDSKNKHTGEIKKGTFFLQTDHHNQKKIYSFSKPVVHGKEQYTLPVEKKILFIQGEDGKSYIPYDPHLDTREKTEKILLMHSMRSPNNKVFVDKLEGESVTFQLTGKEIVLTDPETKNNIRYPLVDIQYPDEVEKRHQEIQEDKKNNKLKESLQ